MPAYHATKPSKMIDALIFAIAVTLTFCFRARIFDWLRGDCHFTRIRDKFKTFRQVEEALRGSGLESCELIVGIDFTKVNAEPFIPTKCSCACGFSASGGSFTCCYLNPMRSLPAL